MCNREAYLYHLGYMLGVQEGLTSILNAMLDIAIETEYGLTIYLNKSLKMDIAKELSVSLARIDNAITIFVKSEYMTRSSRGKYIFNKTLFGDKKWRSISNVLAAFNYGTGEIKVVFERE